MNHRMSYGHKDKRAARGNLSDTVPSSRASKDKTPSTSGIHRSVQRGGSVGAASVETDTSVQAVEEAARKKHKLPKTLEEAMRMNRKSVLLLSVPESDAEFKTDNDMPSSTMEDQAEQDALSDCSITSIHIAEGRQRFRQRMVLPGEVAKPGIHADSESKVAAVQDGSSARGEASVPELALSQFGSLPFRLSGTTNRDEVSIVFERPFRNTQYIVAASTSVPGMTVSVTKRQEYSATLTVERVCPGSACKGEIMWIAVGY